MGHFIIGGDEKADSWCLGRRGADSEHAEERKQQDGASYTSQALAGQDLHCRTFRASSRSDDPGSLRPGEGRGSEAREGGA